MVKSGEGAAPAEAASPLVVGIGASAGGLDAFTRLVRELPADTGLAYVFVQHLDPTHESQLPAILNRAAKVPVVAATDGTQVEANHAYVIPPGAALTVSDGHLRVVTQERIKGPQTVIDGFLSSLAEVHGSNAVGVILSGSGSDGAAGIEAIKEAGGITFAQDPSSAHFADMPQSAVATGAVDFVLPPKEIAEQLVRIGRRGPDGRADGKRTRDADSTQKILQLLKGRTGGDFRNYRHGTVERRILRRMLVHQLGSSADYLAYVISHPDELDALREDLLIGVTRFFRDPEAFEALRQKGLPLLLKDRPAETPIRVWVAGCSGGEEAYTVAMLLLEFLDEGISKHDIQIFATDLSPTAINRARAGLYPRSIEADVSAERLARFFVREDIGYRIVPLVRDLCVFAMHNVVRDPPFSRLDLITCRNVLIYFEPPLQRTVMPIFHYALKPNGLLMVGTAESAPSELFVPLDKAQRIFRPKPGVPRSLALTLSGDGADQPALRRDPWVDRIIHEARQRMSVGQPDSDKEEKRGPRRPTSRSARGKAAPRRRPAKGSAAAVTEELADSRRQHRDAIEQFEAASEELRAANEELQSTNEELQSTNEELETTKEEVQSTNEELTTVNEELRHRNRELAAASADLSNVFASTQLPIFIVDGALKIRHFTPSADQIFRIIPTDAGRPLGDLRLRVDLPDLEARVTATIESLTTAQVDVRGEAGRWWSLTIRPYLTTDRRVDGAVLVFSDIDEAKKFTEGVEQLSESRRVALAESERGRIEASEANRTKTSFLANMSHDLRTPLTAIAGYTDILELQVHGPLSKEQQVDLDRIKRSAQHLLSMINDILNFTRLGAGTVELNIGRVPLSRVLGTVEAMVLPQLNAKGLAFERRRCDDVVMADEEKLQQVMLNLIGNAIKFTDTGSVSVTCQADGATVRIAVTDTGRGIDADGLPRIFEPFLQLNRTLTSVEERGIGLGLAISRDLARRMGGDLTAVSEPGVGSTFTLTLPVA